MAIIQLLVTVAGFIGLFVYQRNKIRTLETQNTAQSELFEKVKVYFEIYDPQKLKTAMELMENATKERSKVEVKKIEEQFSKEIKKTKFLSQAFNNVSLALIEAMVDIPHDKRVAIVNDIKESEVRKVFEGSLPVYERLDQKRGKSIKDILNNLAP